MFRVSFIFALAVALYHAVPCCVYAAPLTDTLAKVECASDEFRGSGIAASESEAVASARAMIAGQIRVSVSYRFESKSEQLTLNGKERLKMTNIMQTEQKTDLLNAQDAQIKKIIASEGSFGAVACMSRANAAKPYLIRQKQIADTISMLAKATPSLKSPKQKKETWQKTSAYYSEYEDNERLLQSLGSTLDDSDKIFGLYEFVKADYQNFCSSQEIYWKDTDDYNSKILLSKFSGDFLINTGKCKTGLQISVEDAELKCEYKATLGNHLCVFRPMLKGASCSNDIFFQVQLNPAISALSKTNIAAKNTLESKIRNSNFDQWKQEIKKWISTCVE